jgi:glycine oxidase
VGIFFNWPIIPHFLKLAPRCCYNNSMLEHPDVLVIGGGVIGLSAAYFLAREQVRVQVLDRGDFGQEASWAGAGILSPGDPACAPTPYDQLRAHGAALFPMLSAELKERTGIDNGYLRCGGLEFSEEEDQAAAQEWRGEGIAFETLSPRDLRRLEPAIAGGLGRVYHLPDIAQLRNPRHVKALLAGCRKHGVRLQPGCTLLGFERHGDRLMAAKTTAGRLPAGQFLLATGAWTDPLLEQVGWRPGVRPVRGQIALLNTGAPLFGKILLHGKRYLVPRPDGRVLIGSTEEDVGFDKRTTARAIGDLLAFALGLVPGLADAPLERCWAGLRPGSPDGLPFLGPVPGLANLLVAAGHFRSGIQWSPITGLLIKELVLGQPPTIALEPFRLDRPAFRS